MFVIFSSFADKKSVILKKKMQFTVPFVSSKQNNTQNSCSFASEVVEKSDFTLL